VTNPSTGRGKKPILGFIPGTEKVREEASERKKKPKEKKKT